MISAILFPTDGSPDAEAAKHLVKELAAKYQADVTVLYAYEIPDVVILHRYDVTYEYIEYEEKHIREMAAKLMDSTRQEFAAAGVKVNTSVEKGRAGKVIVEWAQSHPGHMIVMGSRGLGTLRGFLLGSVSNYVLHHAAGPVMVVPGKH